MPPGHSVPVQDGLFSFFFCTTCLPTGLAEGAPGEPGICSRALQAPEHGRGVARLSFYCRFSAALSIHRQSELAFLK